MSSSHFQHCIAVVLVLVYKKGAVSRFKYAEPKVCISF